MNFGPGRSITCALLRLRTQSQIRDFGYGHYSQYAFTSSVKRQGASEDFDIRLVNSSQQRKSISGVYKNKEYDFE